MRVKLFGKRLVSLALALTMVWGLAPSFLVEARAIEDGNFEFEIDVNNKAVITGFSSNATEIENLLIPAMVQQLGAKYSVVGVRYSAFENNTDIKTLTIAEGVQTIGAMAFRDCSNLEEVNISGTVTTIEVHAFASCINLETVIMKSGVQSIGAGAFLKCNKIRHLVVPDTVLNIGDYFLNVTNNVTLANLEHTPILRPQFQIKNLLEKWTIPVYDGYESAVVTADGAGESYLGNAAKWTNTEKTTANICVDYGEKISAKELDVMFVLDYSASMQAAQGKDGRSSPQILQQAEVVQSAVEALLSCGADIRIAMTAFGSEVEWTTGDIAGADSGFTTNASALIGKLSLGNAGNTKYTYGLNQALQMIQSRSRNDRKAIVIFISDGAANDPDQASTSAKQLRDAGIAVYPLGIYVNSSDWVGPQQDGIAILKSISFDENTVYLAEDSAAFETEIEKLLDTAVGTTDTTVVETLSANFKVNNVNDIKVTAGKVSLGADGKTITWDLAGANKGIIHNMTIAAQLDETYKDTSKPINTALTTTGGITAQTHPMLARASTGGGGGGGGGSVTTYTVTYDANGGSGGKAVSGIQSGTNHTVLSASDTGVTRTGYTWKGWNTKADGTGTAYEAGNTFAVKANTTLYAQWTSILNKDDHFAYLNGYPGAVVKIENDITRAEVASIFYRLLRSQGSASATRFSDVASGAWYADAIQHLASIGVLQGYPDGSFHPDAPITRAEFAAVAAKFDNLSPASGNIFSDISDNHWATTYINSAYTKGWVSGYPDGTFRADNLMTRAELVTVVNKILERNMDEAAFEKVENPYQDLRKQHWAYRDVMEASFTHTYTRDAAKKETWSTWKSFTEL